MKRFRRERSFGYVVGGAFAALGLWWMYRAKFATASRVALVVGALLLVFGALAPRALVHPYRWWMALAEKLGWVMTRVILAIVFFLVLLPIGAIRRVTGADPLRRRSKPQPTAWYPYPERHRDPRHYEKSF